jgi:hypothetical protein
MNLPKFFGGANRRNSVEVEYSGYYVPTHTWAATPGEPQLSVEEMYEALDMVDDVYPEPGAAKK